MGERSHCSCCGNDWPDVKGIPAEPRDYDKYDYEDEVISGDDEEIIVIKTRRTGKMTRKCPQGAVLNIKGEHFECDTMDQMHESSDSHDGWPHGSMAAEAIWGEKDFNGIEEWND